MLLSTAQKVHAILNILEEVCLLDEEVLVEDLEKLPVPENVRCADLDGHGVELVDGRLAAEVVVGPAR